MKQEGILHIIAITLSVWFLLTSWLWSYGQCLLIAYPFGGLSLYFWFLAKKTDPQNRLNVVTPVILGLGLTASIASLLLIK